jgi:dihydroneopterin aldolase
VSDVVFVEGIHLDAEVGVLESEHGRTQPLLIDVELDVDIEASGVSDDLNDTVNYAAAADLVVAITQSKHHELLEHLADRIARGCLDLDGRVSGVSVTVRKLEPPVTMPVSATGVRRRLVR